jgi:hypothetical protein
MDLDPTIFAYLPPNVEITVTLRVSDLMAAFSGGAAVPEYASTVQLAHAWGFPSRKWREWAAAGLIEGAVCDNGGAWRLPREAAREQFERALGREVPPPASVSHLPKAHGPRKKRPRVE